MDKFAASLLISYIGVRHLLPPITIEANYRDDRELLSKYSFNMGLFDVVNAWYDTNNFCGGISRYYWRRIKIKDIPRE